MEQPGVLGYPEVMRSLLVALDELRGGSWARVDDANEPERVGKPWSEAEDQRLSEGFRRGETLPALMSAHGRGEGGILARLVRLKLATNKHEARARFR